MPRTSTRDHRGTLARTLRDAGLAAWFGGALMGLVGLHGASGRVQDPTDRFRVATAGWARWAPVQGVAIGAHLLGRAVVRSRRTGDAPSAGAGESAAARLVVTAAALLASARTSALGARALAVGAVPTRDAVRSLPATPGEVAVLQQQLRFWQWAVPALTGALVALLAHQGEARELVAAPRGRVRTALAGVIR